MKEAGFRVLFRIFFYSHQASKSVVQKSRVLNDLSIVGGKVVFCWHDLALKEICFDSLGKTGEVLLKNSRVSIFEYFVGFFVFEFEFWIIDEIVDVPKCKIFSTYKIAWTKCLRFLAAL